MVHDLERAGKVSGIAAFEFHQERLGGVDTFQVEDHGAGQDAAVICAEEAGTAIIIGP